MSDTSLDGLFTLDDFEDAARSRLPRAVWDYLAGGAGEERTLAANRAAFAAVRLLPRVLAGAGVAATGTTLLGREFAAPIGIAPCAYHTLAHPDGEVATARAAAAAGLPFTVSTYSGRSFQDIRAGAGDVVLWQQIYCLADRSIPEKLVRRAVDAGVEALVLTVDTPHLGHRLRDLRNGFRLPEGIVPANLDAPAFASPAEHARAANDAALDWSAVGWLRAISGLPNDAALDWSAVGWLRAISGLPVLVKGVLTGADAARAVQAGVGGIMVSNHGGRQLDGVPAALEALPGVVGAVRGRVPVLVDGGVRTGSDVLAALALGADGVLVGRPVLNGLAVAGEAGARRVLESLVEGFRDALTLAGVPAVDEVGPDLVDVQRLAVVGGPAVPARPVVRVTATRPAGLTPPSPSASSALPPIDPMADTVWIPSVVDDSRGPLRRAALHSSLSDPDLDTMAFLNEIADRFPDAVSFAPGRPYEGFFEMEDVFASVRRYRDTLAEAGRSEAAIRSTLYQYGPSAGIIRELIAESLRVDEGMAVEASGIVVTVGAQEAMLLVLRALFGRPEDVLLVSTPCYVGIVGAAKLLDIRIAPVPERPAGISPADIEAAIADQRDKGLRPRAVYVVPDHGNPSGNTMDPATRRDLLDVSRRTGVLLIEDSPYRLVSPGERLPTLKSLDSASAEEPAVVHIGSFAKSMFPGARVGYVVADQPVLVDPPSAAPVLLADELARIKSMVTVNTPTLSQAAVAGTLIACRGRLSELNEAAAAHYGENLKALLDALTAHFGTPDAPDAPDAPTWNTPSGGFFLTLNVPFRADAAALARSAADFGVLWTPMEYFYPGGQGGRRQLRLSFSALTPDRIREGVERLARFVASETKGSRGDAEPVSPPPTPDGPGA